MGGCQNYGPFLGTLNMRCCIIIGTQKLTIILTTTHIRVWSVRFGGGSNSHVQFAGLEGLGGSFGIPRYPHLSFCLPIYPSNYIPQS